MSMVRYENSAICPNREMRLILETPDGMVFTGRCRSGSINMSPDVQPIMSGFGPVDYVVTGQEFDIELSVIGSPVLYRGADVAPIVVSRFLPKEWLCEFCGRANKLDQIQCGSCGWYRGLITDVVKEAGLW